MKLESMKESGRREGKDFLLMLLHPARQKVFLIVVVVVDYVVVVFIVSRL